MPKSSGDPGPTTAATRRRSSPPKVRFTVAPSLFHYEIGNPVDGGGTTGVVEALNKRQPPSCDNCRTRKLRCSGRPELIELGAEATATVPCDHCREWSLDCSYRYNRKRRGRRNRVVERLADEQRARKQSLGDTRQATGTESESEDDGPGGSMSGLEQGNGMAGSQDLAFDTLGPAEVRDSRFDFQIGNPQPSGSSQWTHPPVSRSYPPQQPAQGPPMSSGSYGRSYDSSQSRQDRLSFQASPNSANSFPPLGSLPGSVIHPRSGGTYVSVSPQTNGVSPSMALSEASVPATTSIESMLNRDLAMHIIDLYFAHVYCIIPVIHRPSFMADLANHEEEKRPVFFALIMAMIAMTLIHIPRTFFPTLPPEGVRKLSDHCLKAVYAITRREMDLITVDLICIKYFAIVIHNKHGNVGLESSAFGEALHLSITLGLHREDMYADLNPIEAERRRRAWFLIYNADKFEAASRAKPVLLRSDEFMGPEATELPAEIDDKSITIHAYLPSSSPVPLICGFNILTRIVSILGDLLVHERDIRRRPPTEPEALLVALREVRKMQSSIKAISDRLPRPFQLEADADSLPAPGWEEVMRDQLDLFFQDPMASETAKDGYLVLRANVHVTLAMTRLRLILHRENLIERSGPPGTPARSAAELVATDLGESVDWRHGVYQDLFKAVHGIPIQALAANGPSLVTKIRVVAVTLLDALPASDYGDSNVQGIAAYLLDFLNIMTSIESQFTD